MASNELQFETTAQVITDENGSTYMGYGFKAHRNGDTVFEIDNLCCEASEIDELISLLRDNDVSAVHFKEVADDFILRR